MSIIDQWGDDLATYHDECAARAQHEAFLEEVRRDESEDDTDDLFAGFNAWMRGDR